MENVSPMKAHITQNNTKLVVQAHDKSSYFELMIQAHESHWGNFRSCGLEG